MLDIGAARLEDLLDYPGLIDAIEKIFASGATAPERHHHTISVPGKSDGTLLLMPAWVEGSSIGVKTATIFPSNVDEALPAVAATYLLLDANTGFPIAAMDGKMLTILRTAATSAYASKRLSKPESHVMTMIGAGSMAAPLIRAHRTVRPISEIHVWNRTVERAERLGAKLADEQIDVLISSDLEASISQSDIVSCATLSKTPIVNNTWVQQGTHLDLVGAYTAKMRETDSDLIGRSRVFVDTLEGALSEAGDLIQAANEGPWAFGDICGTLSDLASKHIEGRVSSDEITIFKSVGSALEDLAAARLAFERESVT